MSLTDTTSFPGGIDVFPELSAGGGDQLNTLGKEHDALHDKADKAIVAMERVIAGPTFYNVEGRSEATFDLRWAAAKGLAESSGGCLVVTPGPKTSAGLGTITKPNVSIWMPGGATSTPITLTGAAGLDWANSPATVEQQGSIRGLHLIGTAAGCVGLDLTDTGTWPALDDVILAIAGAGSRGIRVTDAALWNERATGDRLHLNHCTVGMELIGTGVNNSLAYANLLDLRMNIGVGQIGVLTTGTALVYGGLWHVLFNIDGTGGIAFQLGSGTSISGWGIIRGEQTSGTGGIFRDTSPGGIWALSGYMNVQGCTDLGGGIFPPIEYSPTGQAQHRWPAAPTLTMGAGAGSGAPTPTVSGNDVRGTVLAGSGTGPSAGDFITVAYANPLSYAQVPDITPFGGITAGQQPFLAAITPTGFTVGFLVAPAASQPYGTYGFTYTVTA